MIKKLIISDTSHSGIQVFENVEATTFGELKKELFGKVDFDKKSVVVRSTRTNLLVDEARIPNEEEVILFLGQVEIKGGMLSRSELYEASRAELQDTLREASPEWLDDNRVDIENDSTDDLMYAAEEFLDSEEYPESTTLDTKERAIALLRQVVEMLEELDVNKEDRSHLIKEAKSVEKALRRILSSN